MKYEKISSEVLMQTSKTIADAITKASDLQKVVDILRHSNLELLAALKACVRRKYIMSEELYNQCCEAIENAEEI